jgi:transcriptional regulator with XRE-family HTH domain
MEKHSFGQWLRLRRKALDLTQDALADRVGCSVGTIRKIESEERRPSAQIAERLAEILVIPQNERTSFLRFARGELRSAPAEKKEDFPWQFSATPARSNLPAAVTSLIGREREIAEVHNYLSRDDIRLVTLIGPPGIGKTRLSMESARRSLQDFPDGVFFIALAPLDDPALVAPTVAQALNFIEMNRQSATEQLSDGIRDKQMLLVLDNCEHLIEDVSALVSSLLSACPRFENPHYQPGVAAHSG